MSRAHFVLQAAIVFSLVLLVSYPEHRRLRAVSVWRTGGPLAADRNGADGVLRRYSPEAGRGRFEIGWGSIGLERTSATGSAGSSLQRKLYDNTVEGRRRFTTPASVLRLGGRINAIVGRARSALNTAIPNARLVLRNITTGQIEARATANEKGEFVFLDVMPSGYVVELMASDGTIVATSELVTVDLGELRETSVRVSTSQARLASFGNTIGSTVGEPLDTATDAGVSRVAAPETCASPPCDGTP